MIIDGAQREFIKVDEVQLRPWQEVVGTVDGVEIHEERGVFRISLIRRIDLEIPLNKLKDDCVNLVQLGQKITILRTDEAYILKLSKQDDDTKSKAS